MDPKKVEIKNIGNKLSEEHVETTNKDMTAELANLNKLTSNQEKKVVIKIKENDIDLLKDELDITYEEAKNKLIKCQGDVNKVIEEFLTDFQF